MESTKTSRGLLVAILLVTVVALTALDIFQDRVIERQRVELRWLITHTVIRPDVPVDAAAKSAVGAAAADAAKGSASSVAVAAQSAKPAAPATAKP